MAGSVVDAHLQPRKWEYRAVGEGSDVGRLFPCCLSAELLLEHRDEHRVEHGQRVDQSVPIGIVEVRRQVPSSAHRSHGVHVVRVPVGEQYGSRTHVVSP